MHRAPLFHVALKGIENSPADSDLRTGYASALAAGGGGGGGRAAAAAKIRRTRSGSAAQHSVGPLLQVRRLMWQTNHGSL